jgi:hypothetical protein
VIPTMTANPAPNQIEFTRLETQWYVADRIHQT